MRSGASLFVLLILLVVLAQSLGLNTDGVLLLSFKYSVLRDPLLVLENWNYHDQTPCSWKGVFCGSIEGRRFSTVVGLSLPNSQLLGSIPPDLGAIEHLQRLDLSNNSLNGSLPFSLFNNSAIRHLDLSSNVISGELPEVIPVTSNLQSLNLSDNALAGKIPANLGSLSNLSSLSLKNNYFSGVLPSGFRAVEILDLSSNLINGSLRSDFGGDSLGYFNASYNRLSGTIPPEFGEKIPADAIVDLSFNDLRGPVPESPVFKSQKPASFNGNPDLCGEPTGKPCPIITSSSSSPSPTYPPAIAAIPRTINSDPVSITPRSASEPGEEKQSGLKPATIVGIVAGDIVGVGILAMIFLYIYRLKKRKNKKKIETTLKNEANTAKLDDSSSSSSSESRGFTRWSCLRKQAEDEQSSSSDDTAASENDDEVGDQKGGGGQQSQRRREPHQGKGGTLVTIDGGKVLELETLLKASAYILGATGSSIMYKAVLEDGTTLAVRRIGENTLDRFKDFENQVRVVAKLVHPNLVRVLGFYWGADEKLIIYDFVPNGSLANARYMGDQKGGGGQQSQRRREPHQGKGGTLVTIDGGKVLELETLLKASAYILGATGSSIMYKAVLEDGTTLAVRRIGENTLDRFKDFENQVRVVAKLVHPNLVRVLGFYWGADEKLIIYDFVPNGSLANARYKKVGSSPCHLPWDSRLKIAKGVARGLAYLHEKKHVHGNLKPSNILLGSDMEPKIGDFGLERIVTGESSYKAWGSARNFGSKRSTASRDSFPEFVPGPSPSPSPSAFGISPYHAPESLRSLKPNPKWDVFSFGVILLELLTGKVVVVDESGQGPGIMVDDDKNRALRMADVAIRADLEGKEEALLACFKVGYNCASPVAQKRPSMKDVLQVLEKFPSSSSSSYYY